MPWARFGDAAATYPKLLKIAGYRGADDRAVNEVRGWLYACATQSASHVTDYVIDAGTAQMLGGARTKQLTAWCVKAGLLTPTKIDGEQVWMLINDPEFIHIRTRDELDWEAQRRADRGNLGLVVPVRKRDGDQCRYCGYQVQWSGRKTNRSAEYDHRVPGCPATVETLVVACRSCNGARQDDPTWDERNALRPAPAAPRYGRTTATFLTNNGHPTTPNLAPDATTSSSSATPAATRPAPGQAARPAAAAQAQARPAGRDATTSSSADTAAARPTQGPEQARDAAAQVPARTPRRGDEERAESPRKLPPTLDRDSVSGSDETGSAGSGRDGTVTPSPGPAQAQGRKRRRRGGRGGRGARGGSPDLQPLDPRPDDRSPPHPPPPPSRPARSDPDVCLSCGGVVVHEPPVLRCLTCHEEIQ